MTNRIDRRTALATGAAAGASILLSGAWPNTGKYPVTPDILIIAGQSNVISAGVTIAELPPRLSAVYSNIKTWNGSAFVVQQIGINSSILTPDFTAKVGQWGPEAEFAFRYHARNPGRVLAIIKFGQGSTPLTTVHGPPNWGPTQVGSLFDNMQTFITNALASLNVSFGLLKPRWLLWMQGEQDAVINTDANNYATNLAAFFVAARSRWSDANLNIAIGEISTLFANSSTVRAAQAAANTPTTPFIPSDTWPMWGPPHYDGIGVAAMGAQMWNALNGVTFTPSSTQSANFLARTSGLPIIHQEAYDALITGLVHDGVFAKLDALWVPATNDSTTATLNLIANTLPLVPTGTAWVVQRGYFTNGSAGSYLDTGINLSSFVGHAGQNAGHVGIFPISTGQYVFAAGVGVGVPGIGNGVWAGVSTDPIAETNLTRIQPQDGGGNSWFSYNDGTGANSGVVVPSGIGHFVVNRSDATHTQGYYNGTQVASPNKTVGAAPNLNLNFGIENSVNNGRIFGVDTQLLAAAHIGGTLTAADISNLYTRLNNYFAYLPVYKVGGLTASRYIDRAWNNYTTSPTGGGGPSLLYRNLFDNLLTALDASGVARKLDAMWIWAQTQNTPDINIISKFFASVPHGSPTYISDQGYTGVDASSTVYVDLAWDPASFVGDSFYVQNSAHYSVWALNNVLAGASGGVVMGGTDGTTENRLLLRNSAGNLQAGINGTGFISAANANSIGHWVVNRSSSSAVQVYKNGASFTSGSDTSKPILNQNFFALASNTSGVAAQGSACQLAMASVGGSLTATDVTNFYAALRVYMTGVGIP